MSDKKSKKEKNAREFMVEVDYKVHQKRETANCLFLDLKFLQVCEATSFGSNFNKNQITTLVKSLGLFEVNQIIETELYRQIDLEENHPDPPTAGTQQFYVISKTEEEEEGFLQLAPIPKVPGDDKIIQFNNGCITVNQDMFDTVHLGQIFTVKAYKTDRKFEADKNQSNLDALLEHKEEMGDFSG